MKEGERLVMNKRMIPSGTRLLAVAAALFAGVMGGVMYLGLTGRLAGPGKHAPGGPRPFMAIFDTQEPLMPAGVMTTIDEASRLSSYGIPVPVTSALTAPEVWYSAEANEVALRYDSSLVIQYAPLAEGLDPRNPYAAAAADWNTGYTTEIAGHPAWVVPQDAQAPGAPPVNEVYVAIDGVDVQLLGKLPLETLLELAANLS